MKKHFVKLSLKMLLLCFLTSFPSFRPYSLALFRSLCVPANEFVSAKRAKTTIAKQTSTNSTYKSTLYVLCIGMLIGLFLHLGSNQIAQVTPMRIRNVILSAHFGHARDFNAYQ